MARRLMLAMAGLTALVVLAAGCGGKSPAPTKTVAPGPYIGALTTSLARYGAGSIDLTLTEAACVAPKWVDVLQADRLQRAGVVPRRLEADRGLDQKAGKVALGSTEVSRLVDAVGECDVDLQAAFIASLTQKALLSVENQACLADSISEKLARRVVGIEITEGTDGPDADPALRAEFFAALSACPGAIDLSG